jgi:hypothetical protein
MRVKHMLKVVLLSWSAIATGSLLVACGDKPPQPSKAPLQGVESPSPTPKPAELTVQINRSPLFESPEGWGPGFAKAVGHGRGVVVGPGGLNRNVFAQSFPTKAGEPYKIVTRASSVGKTNARGRFQVNWTDPEGRFISSSIKAFGVTPEEKTFETNVNAPDGAVSGTLYVVGDGPKDVVRYTEMRLLGRGDDNAPANPTAPAKSSGVSLKPFPRPPNLTPLDGSGRTLTVAESQYYFYHAVEAMQRRAKEEGADFIMYVMPDYNISRLMPAIRQLRSEGIKVLAYEPNDTWRSGVDTDWYWQKTDSHWTEAAVRLTADEILNMWKKQEVANRPFSKELMSAYSSGFSDDSRVRSTSR